MFNQEVISGIIRHGLTFIGGILIAKGIISEAVAMDLMGAILASVGTIWSVVAKIKAVAGK